MNRKYLAILFMTLLAVSVRGADFGSLRNEARANRRVPLTGSLRAVVCSDCKSSNTETCPNIAGNIVATAESFRTVYIQNEDGSLGMRMILRGYYGNRLRRGDMVAIDLDGSFILMENNPRRYTLENVDIGNIEILSHGNALPEKRKCISALVPDDIYTHVTLQGLEFFKKEGGYINVFEKAVYTSPLNRMLSADGLTGYPPASECVDAWPSLMLDDRGDHIYMLINSTCLWRRNNMGVPQGRGCVCGVIVHSGLSHYGNSLGDYSIRPMYEEDINIGREPESSYGEACGWHWDFNRYMELDTAAETGSGRLYVSEGIKMSLDDEYDARHSFDGWKSARMTGSRSNAALRLDAKCSAWYAADAGLYVHASLSGLEGRDLRFCFSFVAGRDHSRNSVDYPVDWSVSYSLDGKTFARLPETFVLSPIMFVNVRHGDRAAVLHNGLAAGFTEHCVSLPESLAGRDSVIFRISAASDRTATMPYIFDGPCREGRAKDCRDADNVIRFGDISVKYLKK